MKRKILLAAVILGIVALSSTTTYVLADRALPWTNTIYSISDPENNANASVSVFDDGRNKCYVANTNFWSNHSQSVAISCVKGDGQ